MILVSGSKRSGTSMWMQILAAAGLPIIGERMPASWAALIADANPDGFYESQLSAGIYYRTNPHPHTGAYLFPEHTRDHAVKVFAPGLVRSDLAFVDRVIVTIREWREHSRSVLRLRATFAGTDINSDRDSDSDTDTDPGPGLLLPPVYEWWSDTFALLRDVATRRYPVHWISYARLLGDPEREIIAALGWLGVGAAEPAIAAVHARPPPAVDGLREELAADLDPTWIATFDTLYDHIHRGIPLSPALVRELNATDRAVRPRLLAHNARLKDDAVSRLLQRRGASDA